MEDQANLAVESDNDGFNQEIEGMTDDLMTRYDLSNDDLGIKEEKQETSADEIKAVDEQPEGDSEDKELSSEEVLDKLMKADKEEQPEKGDAEAFLEVSREGELRGLSKEEATEYAQKGLDYTVKTQALAEERKAWESEKQETESEYSKLMDDYEKRANELEEIVTLKSKWDATIDMIADEDPDLMEDIQAAFKKVEKSYSNPVFNSQLQQLQSELNKLKESETSKQDESIREKYNRELGEVQGKYNEKLTGLGMSIDWERVKNAYINGAETVEKAFHSEYAAELLKLYESKVKLNKAKAKASAKVPVVEASKPVVNEASGRARRSSYNEDVQAILASL